MESRGSAQFSVMESVKSAALPGAIVRLNVRLLGISPMIWRRVLVPDSMTLRELHGVVQLAMGWEGIHLFEFVVRCSTRLSGRSSKAGIPGSSTSATQTARSMLLPRDPTEFCASPTGGSVAEKGEMTP